MSVKGRGGEWMQGPQLPLKDTHIPLFFLSQVHKFRECDSSSPTVKLPAHFLLPCLLFRNRTLVPGRHRKGVTSLPPLLCPNNPPSVSGDDIMGDPMKDYRSISFPFSFLSFPPLLCCYSRKRVWFLEGQEEWLKMFVW